MSASPFSVNFDFRTEEQRDFFVCKIRNQCMSGGFGSGKTFIGCMKALYFLATFPGYRIAIVRFEESKLKQTTLQTFFKICPPELYDPRNGGNRADSRNECTLINGSKIIWMNLKDTDEGMIRGLEVNSVLVDQAEEISESMYIYLSARVGRWDRAIVPQYLLDKHPEWPLDKHGLRKIPSYMMILCNPDSEIHWIFRRYHPDSELFQSKYNRNHIMFNAVTTSATVTDELLAEMMENDETWVDRFVFAKWGIPGGQIHRLLDESILTLSKEYHTLHPGTILIDEKFIEEIITKGNLYRVADHGDSSPTACGWFSAYKNNHYLYREYYQPDRLVSYHRKRIAELTGNEQISKSIIDPACAKKMAQKYGGRWSTIDEYNDMSLSLESDIKGKHISVPSILWEPGDNNELATRNRISEFLRTTSGHIHPITGNSPSPKMYFIVRSPEYPNGAYHAIQQIKAQKREKIGTIDGKDIFSEDRDKNVVDHAYDYVRYYIAEHARGAMDKAPGLPVNSFGNMRNELIALKKYGHSELFSRRAS